ncbi:MAG: DUF4065 domain-containing protein [Candidatus Gribaldobacteria bacterium]|nr:DUF4065 domain-containing protein [Candidatus Gribaldobacteria bacterium]
MPTLKKLGERIKQMRQSFGFSQAELAGLLGIQRQSFGQVEKGERGLDSLELVKLAEVFSVSADELLSFSKEVISTGKLVKSKFKFQKDKLENIILYTLEQCGGKPNLGETVLYKLLYYFDFDHYELYGKPITGMQYVKLQFGPVPQIKQFKPVIDRMINDKKITVIKQLYFNKLQKRYVALIESNKRCFEIEEKEVIDSVIKKLSDMSATQIENYVHGDIPWKVSQMREIINYDLVFDRTVPYAKRDYDEAMQNAAGADTLRELGPISKQEYDYYEKLAVKNKNKL